MNTDIIIDNIKFILFLIFLFFVNIYLYKYLIKISKYWVKEELEELIKERKKEDLLNLKLNLKSNFK